MDDDLRAHQPGEEARRRAQAAGLDLDLLRTEDPTTYRMLCATPVVTIAASLQQEALAALQSALDDQRLFDAQLGAKLLVLAFPGPSREQLEQLDNLLAGVAQAHSSDHAFFREVHDRSGTRRELDLPVAPGDWDRLGSPAERPPDAVVGPFDSEAQAQQWGSSDVDGSSGFTFDVIHFAGAWFCDVFYAADL